MIALGGSLGTGIFITSGSSLYLAGAGGALIAYMVMGIMVYFLMASLGEMASHDPAAGSFIKYANQYVSKPFGFAMGYNYWFNWAITIAVELVAATLIMSYWFPHTNPIIWVALFFCAILALNLLSVEYFGESEYWLSLVKVLTIVIFIIAGLFIIYHDAHTKESALNNWSSLHTIFSGGFNTTFEVFLLAGFSFQGSELVGIAAGEAKNPTKSIPKAIKQVFWRIILFYILTMFIISCTIHYTDSRLLNINDNVSLSPFTLLFAHAGLHHAADMMNAVILIAVLSACNSDMYSATRILWHLGKTGDAPKVFAYINKFGVPIFSLLATASFGLLGFLCNHFGSGNLFIWLVNISSLAGFVAWIGIAISHYKFRKKYIKDGGNPNALIYRARFFPLGPLSAIALCVIIIIGQAYVLFLQGNLSILQAVAIYIGIPIIALIWLGKKIHLKLTEQNLTDRKHF